MGIMGNKRGPLDEITSVVDLVYAIEAGPQDLKQFPGLCTIDKP